MNTDPPPLPLNVPVPPLLRSEHDLHLPSPWPPTNPSGQRKLPAIESFFISSLAPSIAVLFTNPFDTAKVRLQLQGEVIRRSGSTSANLPGIVLYNGSFDCMHKTFKNEGIRGLQKGLYPAVLREATKNLFRLGMYDSVMSLIHPNFSQPNFSEPPPPWKLVLAGAICGAMGSIACNPFELVKTRLQSSATGALASVGHQHGYTGVWMGLRSIVGTDGWIGLYRGSAMSTARSMVGSGSNLAAFHMIKAWLMADSNRVNSQSRGLGWEDGITTDMVSGLSSGLASVICMNPIDVLRTRYYNQPYVAGRGQLYSSGLDTFRKVVTNEGYRALYKGFSSHFLRIGPHFCLTFMFLGILRRSLINVHDHMDHRANFNAFDLNHDLIMDPNEIEHAAKLAGLPPSAVNSWTNSRDGITLAQFAAFSDDVRRATLAAALQLAFARILNPPQVASSVDPNPAGASSCPQKALIEEHCIIRDGACSIEDMVTKALPHAQRLQGPLANALLGRANHPDDVRQAMNSVLHAWVRSTKS